MIKLLWEGRFLTRERVRLWSLAILLATIVAIGWLALTAQGNSDYRGRPLGTDFSNVYAAGVLAREDHASQAYDWPSHYAKEQAIFGKATPFYGWHYPPFFLILAEALSHLPYIPALILWQGVTFLFYGLALYALVRTTVAPGLTKDPLFALLAFSFPACFVNLIHGQNGFLSAAIMMAGLALLSLRPFCAGVVLGLLAYKPQFVLLLPFALIGGRHWRALIGLICSVAFLTIVATAVFGLSIWDAFLQSAHLSRTIVLEAGNTGFEKMQSVFAAARLLGAPVFLAYALQALVLVIVLTALVIVWRKPALQEDKGALLVLATTLSTPYCLDYDLVLLAPVIVLMSARGYAKGFQNGEILLLCALWLIPLAARCIAGITHFSPAPFFMLAAFAFTFRKAQLAF